MDCYKQRCLRRCDTIQRDCRAVEIIPSLMSGYCSDGLKFCNLVVTMNIYALASRIGSTVARNVCTKITNVVALLIEDSSITCNLRSKFVETMI